MDSLGIPKLTYASGLWLIGQTIPCLPVSKYCPFFQLMEEPVLLPDSPPAFTQDTLFVSTEVYLQVALLGSPVITVRALEGLLPGVCAHVKGKDAIKAETFAT